VLNVGGLNGEFISHPEFAYLYEMYYSDGKSCRFKAVEYANNFLKKQWTHKAGKFRDVLTDTQTYTLHGKIDRITVEHNPQGSLVTVELTNERARPDYVPDRQLDRDRQLITVVPGLQELRRASETSLKIGHAARSSKAARKMLADAFNGNFAERGNAKKTIVQPPSTAAVTTAAVGTCFVKKPNTSADGSMTQTRPVILKLAGSGNVEFAGVTVRNEEPLYIGKGAEITLQSEGYALALVRGPVNVNDSIGFKLTGAARDLGAMEANAQYPVGVALQSIGGTGTALVRVRLGNPGTSTGSSTVAWFVYKSMQSDHLVCRSYEGGLEGSIDVNVYKPHQLRFSVGGRTIDGVAISYSAYNIEDQTRTAGLLANTYTEVITTRYVVGDIIAATQIEGEWVDMNIDGRAWAKAYA
jgi:hypothetical protein